MFMTPDRFAAAPDFPTFLSTVAANTELWPAVYRTARLPEGMVERARAIPGEWKLIALAEDWCGDAVNVVPILSKLVEQLPNFELKVMGRDANPDLMDSHLTGTSRSIPVVIVLDDQFEERRLVGAAPRAAAGVVHGRGAPAGEDRALQARAPVVRARPRADAPGRDPADRRAAASAGEGVGESVAGGGVV
jgi:hypothetical protein